MKRTTHIRLKPLVIGAIAALAIDGVIYWLIVLVKRVLS